FIGRVIACAGAADKIGFQVYSLSSGSIFKRYTRETVSVPDTLRIPLNLTAPFRLPLCRGNEGF
ncbi:MAG: hypothetical protein ABI700_12540, partial [Chloroflexota bacterium]